MLPITLDSCFSLTSFQKAEQVCAASLFTSTHFQNVHHSRPTTDANQNSWLATRELTTL